MIFSFSFHAAHCKTLKQARVSSALSTLSLFPPTSSPDRRFIFPSISNFSQFRNLDQCLSKLDDISLSHLRLDLLHPIYYFRFHLSVSYINKRKSVIHCDFCHYIFDCPYYLNLSVPFCSSFSSLYTMYTFSLPYLRLSLNLHLNSGFCTPPNILVYLPNLLSHKLCLFDLIFRFSNCSYHV